MRQADGYSKGLKFSQPSRSPPAQSELFLFLRRSLKPAASETRSPREHNHPRPPSASAHRWETQWWETDFPIKRSRAAEPQFLTHAKHTLKWSGAGNAFLLIPTPFPQRSERCWEGKRPQNPFWKFDWLSEKLFCGPVRRERAVRFFFLFFSLSPAPTSLEERGECHCYGNLVYHKRIAFVTWPNSSAAPTRHRQERRRKTWLWGKKSEKTKAGRRKGRLFATSTFHFWTKGLGSLSRELPKRVQGRGKKKQSTGNRWKTTPPL